MTDSSKDKPDWQAVSRDARILYSLLFYSQGPVDGYLIGEKARDFFLPTGLPLPTLSQIWNLADVSNDNLLTVEEFILTMYFCHGALQEKKLPRSLPAVLKPPARPPVSLPFLTEEEKFIFSKIFEAVDVQKTGFIEAPTAREILTQTGLSEEELRIIWDLSDINRDGRLDYGEWTVACQLIKLTKQGQSLDVPINVFTNLPDRIAPGSLQAGKKRVAEYEERKQKLMKLKERRRQQAEREKKRLELKQTKINLLTQIYDVLEKTDNSELPVIQKRLNEDRENVERQEEIVFSCTCKYFNGQPCYRQFVPEELVNRRMQMKEMTAREQMLVLLGKISCSIHMGELTECSKKKEQTVRQHQKTYYWLEGKQICRATFKFLHSISNDRLSSLLKHYKENGLEPLEKKSGGRKNNTKSFSFEDAKRTVQFMTNYASENALVLPGRVPGFKRDDILLLPSSHTRVFVYSCYHNSLENTGHRIMGQSSFFELWRKLCPFIITAKPMSDLCWICQNNNNLIYRSANLNDNAKSERVKRQEDHLLIVQRERLAYNQLVDTAKQTCRDNGLVSLGLNLPCSKNIRMHYSFDYAQQVHLPSNPLQPGPIYFLVPRKVGIFGVCCEGIPRQVNFLIDEAHLISKGSNAVVSYLDFFFRNYGLGETDVDLHCDNCSGQNKNRFVLWYCAWQVATGLHRSISLHFLIAGHTKFAPDWCFGLLKKAFRRHVVPSLSVLEDVVNGSASVNQAQVTGRENGLTEVPVFDWHQFFNGTCKPVPGIKKYQHFRLKKEHEKVRQATVKIILDEQKVSTDIKQIKEQTDELNRTLRSSHSKATKDPDPFHQLFEERKEYKISEVTESEIFSPFSIKIFSKSFLKQLSTAGADILGENNHHKKMASNVLQPELRSEFLTSLDSSLADVNSREALEEDQIFQCAPMCTDKEYLSELKLDIPFSDLLNKLEELKNEFIKLNSDGPPLVFKNPQDYIARKFVKEEAEKQERLRQHRRASSRESLSGTPDSLRRRSANTTPEPYKRRSYIEHNNEATQAAREYRLKRHSLHSSEDNSPASPRKSHDTKSRSSSSLKTKSKSVDLLSKSPDRSSKKSPAPQPPARSNSKNSLTKNQKSFDNSTAPQKVKVKAAKSEPNLNTFIDYVPKIAIDFDLKPDKSLTADEKPPTSPNNSPTRPSSKKSRAPAPPLSPPINSPSSIQQPNFFADQSKSSNENIPNQQVVEVTIESTSKSQASLQSPVVNPAPPLVSPSSPSLSPSGPTPQRPPRTKKEHRKNSLKSPTSPKPALNTDDTQNIKTEENRFKEFPVKSSHQNGSLNYATENKTVRAERPSSLFTSSFKDLDDQTSPLMKEITEVLAMNDQVKMETSPQRPTRRTSKNKQAPAPPVLISDQFEEKIDLGNNKTSTADANNENPPILIEESKSVTVFSSTNTNSDFDDNRLNGGLKARHTFDRASISSYDSVDSVPPPLPNSAPPPLPVSSPPTDNDPISPEEVIEIEYMVPTNMDLQDSENEEHNRDSHLAASRYDDIEGDSGIMTSLPTSPDETDAIRGVSLISYKNEQTTLKSKPKSSDDSRNVTKESNDRISSGYGRNQSKDGVDSQYRRSHSKDSVDSQYEKIHSQESSSSKDSRNGRSSNSQYGRSPDSIFSNEFQYGMRHSRDTSSSVDSQYGSKDSEPEIDDSSLLGFAFRRSMFEGKKPTQTVYNVSAEVRSPTSPTSPTPDNVLSPKSRKYNSQESQEILEKSRQFAEMVQKPNFSAKAKSTDSDDFSQETLQGFELNRRSVISSSTVRKKDVHSPTETEMKQLQEAEETPVIKTEKNSVRHWEVNTEPQKNKVPDIGWESEQRNSLYSQNIVQENGTTDSVDRESISESLHNTKRQWEGAFKDHIDNRFKDPKEKPKGTVRHWDVKLPNQAQPRAAIKQQQQQVNLIITSSNKMADNESAIDREIRLANEREELLKREKEERLKLEEQNGRIDISSFENSNKAPPVNKPLYHEMTEADRGSEMWQRETLIQQELREQEERELALKIKSLTPVKSQQDNQNSDDVPYESIIQKEIRLQREREEELEKQRLRKESDIVDDITSSPPAAPPTVITSNNINNNNDKQNDINHNEQKVNVSYEDAISGFQHEGESLIAREMRELREREEEVRRQRDLALNNNNKESLPKILTPPKSASSNSIQTSSSSSFITPKQGTWQKDVSPYLQPNHKRSASVDSLASSQSTGRTPSDYTPSRDVKVMPNLQQDSDEETTPKHTPSSETPIQREIRLARDRENELRRSKGLPEITEPKTEPTPPRQKSQNDVTGTPTSSMASPRYRKDSSGQAVRSYASSRLQQELSSQKERELMYKNEGRIITTSEEHIEPMKYREITSPDQVDGPSKRNFNTRGNVSASKLPPSPEVVEPAPSTPQQTTNGARQTSSPVKAVKGGSSAQFSYRESRQTAESKIERELREMREREQELRKQNNPNCVDEEEEPSSPREITLSSQKGSGPDGEKKSLADQWEQICQS